MGITASHETGKFVACINKADSVQDKQQKASGKFYFWTD
jgi:translation initiation factor RLI1